MVDVNSDAFKAGLAAYLDGGLSPIVDCLAAFIKAYEAAKPNGWLPIESAPRDGTKILGFDENAPHVGWHVTKWKNQDWFSDAHPQRSWWPQPTHWQRLPAPPIDTPTPDDNVTK